MTTIDTKAEQYLRELAAELTAPRRAECLACYVLRMLGEFNCDGTVRFAVAYRDARAPRATALERRLGGRGGHCDCEIFLNVYERAEYPWMAKMLNATASLVPAGRTSKRPRCASVRAGSTQPCVLWARILRG